MARLTSSTAEAHHLIEMHKQIPSWGIVEFNLKNGQTIEGLIMRSNAGNNAGSGGNPWPTSYYAEVTVQSVDGRTWLIDYLEVKSARDVSAGRIGDFENAGLVRIVDYPDEKK